MCRNKFIILFFACAGCFADVPMSSVTSGDSDTDTDGGSTGEDTGTATAIGTGTTGEETSETSAASTSGTTTTSDSGSTGGSSGGVGETSGETTGVGSTSGASSTGGSTGGVGPEWTEECIDNTQVMEPTMMSCNWNCQQLGKECVEACGPNGDAGLQASWDSVVCGPPYTVHDLCDQNVVGYIQCCCV